MSTTTRRQFLLAAAAIAPVLAAALIGSSVTAPAISDWYAGLAKPWFTPPNWLFGPAWTLLCLLMAYAFWRVLAAPQSSDDKRRQLVIFLVQILLNGLWSIVFSAGVPERRPRRHRGPLARNRRNDRRLCAARSNGGLAACALSGLDEFRLRAERRRLSAQRLKFQLLER